MVVSACTHETRAKHGKDRKGNQRWKCACCGATFTSNDSRPLGDMRLDVDKAAMALGLLLEGMSIRAVERVTGVKRDTLCDLVIVAGENCQRFLRATIKNVAATHIELDEIWSFVGCKQKTATLRGYGVAQGDSWTWLAIDANSKLILAHTVGQRDTFTCHEFLTQLNSATTGRCQVTSDGLNLYTHNVPYYLGQRCDFAQLIKTYESSQSENRYSPARIIEAEKKVRFGNPDEDRISTSYAERFNLTLRMQVRRFTRLTNAHSKSYRHHAAMVSLFVAYYNFCRKNEALGKQTTPAMSSGLATKVWTVKQLLIQAAN